MDNSSEAGNVSPYGDIVEQLQRDRDNFIKKVNDCDLQIKNYQNKIDEYKGQKLMYQGAIQYADLFMQRFKREEPENG